MARFTLAFLLAAAALALAAPAHAQTWRHGPSGVGIDRLPRGMQLGRVTDNRGDGSDVFVQFGRGREIVTFYVYRSAYPNPALWFERTRLAMIAHVGGPGEGVAPRAFTLGGGAAPNGLREEVALPGGGRFRASAVAIAQYGEWMVKARITSRDGREEIRGRMDALLAAVRLPGAAPAPLPLIVPPPCGDENRMRGRQRQQTREGAIQASLVLPAANAEARGQTGLAADPNSWCREASELPAAQVTIYRRRDGRGWAALIGDSGRAIAARPIEIPDADGAATFVATTSFIGIALLYDRMPAPDEAIEVAIPALAGQAPIPVRVDADGRAGPD